MDAAEEDYEDKLPDDEEEFVDGVETMGGTEPSMTCYLFTELLAGLKFQKQFYDHWQRFLNLLEREGAGFFRLREGKLKSQRLQHHLTFNHYNKCL